MVIAASVTFALVGGGAIVGGGGGLGCLGEVASVGHLSFLAVIAGPLAITLRMNMLAQLLFHLCLLFFLGSFFAIYGLTTHRNGCRVGHDQLGGEERAKAAGAREN